MSSDAPAPGWYPDPAGNQGQRYWDGRAWTEHVSAGTWAAGISQPALPDGARVNTVFIWLYVLLPLVSLVASVLQDPAGRMQEAVRRGLEHPGVTTTPVASPGVLLAQLLGLVLYAAGVVLAYFDWSALKRIGIVRPFHWAFAFIPAPVYIIGRTVVLHRRVHKGYAPLWVYIALTVLGIVVGVVELVQVFAALEPVLREIRSTAGTNA
ncbi:DUF2510 domain-containing protein [Amnibacterium sp. CER49]|uniref:DUF2510 domain-containing protein n=1 Tax=Amnibacterium sp. CER49 TaxID=3039161 RepID=UPI00244B953B|nr:DUF2510 domain-containing protein [Amnibacterium sp. CER49]MDH2445479.1 DUF2510 domain-containing protein [Amnibacterium sp. CER49]